MTQGAGAFGSGFGSAGFDPVADPSGTNLSQAPAALLFDPATRDFRRGADGRFVAIHPVDQAVALALFVQKNSIGSAPETGSEIRSIQRQGGPGFVGKVQDIVRRALKQFTDAGQIRIVDIGIDASIRGRTLISVTYQNLMLAPNAPLVTLDLSV